MLLIGIPLYVCATGSIPIASSLMMKGMSPGAGLVFLIAGPATNTATIAFVGGKLGKKTLLIYLFSIIIGSIFFGLILDFLWFKFSFSLINHHQHQTGLFGLIKTLSAILLVILILKTYIESFYLMFFSKSRGANIVITVIDMTCNNCKAELENIISKIDGVVSVSANPKIKKIYIWGNADKKNILNKIKQAGYSVTDE